MDQTPNLKMRYILPSQAQKRVIHNEVLRWLLGHGQEKAVQLPFSLMAGGCSL